MTQPATDRQAALGRPAVTSRAELEQISLAMFSEQGFDVTSVDEIAAAAGIGRRTFFRYFKSKNDAVWGDFDTQLAAFAAWFERCPADVPWWTAICAAVIDFNSFDAAATASLRNRMKVILELAGVAGLLHPAVHRVAAGGVPLRRRRGSASTSTH